MEEEKEEVKSAKVALEGRRTTDEVIRYRRRKREEEKRSSREVLVGTTMEVGVMVEGQKGDLDPGFRGSSRFKGRGSEKTGLIARREPSKPHASLPPEKFI